MKKPSRSSRPQSSRPGAPRSRTPGAGAPRSGPSASGSRPSGPNASRSSGPGATRSGPNTSRSRPSGPSASGSRPPGSRSAGSAPRRGGPSRGRAGAARRGSDDSARQGRATLKRPGITPERITRILDRQPWVRLEPLLRDAGLEPAPVIKRLRAYSSLLIHWNHSVSNLVSQNDEERFVERHLCESLGPLRTLREAGIDRWLDIGSGGGLPAIPLALAGIGTEWVLVESRRMKTLFLSKVKQEMGLEQIEITCSRIENLAVDVPFGGVTSRATLRLGPTLSEASRFLASGGRAYLWKGERRSEEMREDRSWTSDWTEDRTLELPDTPTVVVSFVRK